MGRWAEVKCNCPNREPLPEGEWFHDPVHRHKRLHLTNQQLKASEEWKEKVEGMFKCGHRDGTLIQFWPGDLFVIGQALNGAYKDQPERFEVFRRIYDWRNYTDEYLALSSDEVALWQLEIEELQCFLSGEAYMGYHEQEAFEKYLGEDKLLYGDVRKTLEDGLKLCVASRESGNPVELFW